MNYSNIFTVTASLVIAATFLGGVFLNLDIKNSKEELYEIQKNIDKIKLEIRRQKIEITTLINPINILNYIEHKNYQPIAIKNVDIIYIKNN